jgi:CRISPR system Cascade subunit CasD
MSTLLLRFAAPLQSWGVESKFNRRVTEREPTKSGVIGLLASALGRGRTEDISDLASLKFGVHIDRPGQLLVDYHLAITEKARKPGVSDADKNAGTFQTRRYYLADAVFLVGLEGDDAFLSDLDEAIKSPAFPLYLGRRSCPPCGKVSLGILQLPLREAMKSELKSEKWETSRLTIVCDAEGDKGFYRRDLPVSFDQTHRKYTFRRVVDEPGTVPVSRDEEIPTEHDPFPAISGIGGQR